MSLNTLIHMVSYSVIKIVIIGNKTKGGKMRRIPNWVIGGRRRLYFFAGAKVLDNIRIADNITVGANAICLKDMAEGGVYIGVSAKMKSGSVPCQE